MADSRRSAGRSSVSVSKFQVFSVVALLALGGAGFLGFKEYSQLKKENQKLSNPQEAAKAETERIKNEVAQLIEVPTDEEPTIATVVDPQKLGDQAFFKNAQKDDRVIIYAKAKKAILYRTSTKKVVEVAPLNIGENQQAQAAPAPNATQTLGAQTEQTPAAPAQ